MGRQKNQLFSLRSMPNYVGTCVMAHLRSRNRSSIVRTEGRKRGERRKKKEEVAESDLSHLHFPYIRDSTSYSFFENFAINTEGKRCFVRTARAPKCMGKGRKGGKALNCEYISEHHISRKCALAQKRGAPYDMKRPT